MESDLLSKAQLARAKLIYQLESTGLMRANCLAAILDACTPSNPCRSAACRVCGLTFQTAVVNTIVRSLDQRARPFRGRMYAATVVPSVGGIIGDRLKVQVFRTIAEQVSAAFAAADLPPAIIGLETSFNEDTTGNVPPHWSVHAHAIGIDWPSAAQKQGLHLEFAPSDLVKRPVRVDLLDDRAQGRLYPFKPERFRRVTGWSDDDGSRRRHRRTKNRPLRSAQAVSLAMVDHKVGFHRRVLTHDIDDDDVRRAFESHGWPRED